MMRRFPRTTEEQTDNTDNTDMLLMTDGLSPKGAGGT